jgi:hypothetical protein
MGMNLGTREAIGHGIFPHFVGIVLGEEGSNRLWDF